MNKEEFLSKLKKNFETQKKYNENAEKAKGRKTFKFIDFFVGQTPGRLTLGFLMATVAIFAAAPLGIWALAFALPGFAVGFFGAKLAEKINLSLSNKFGCKYSRNKINKDTWYHWAYDLICLKIEDLVKSNDPNKVTDEVMKQFVDSTASNYRTYKMYVEDLVSSKIANRCKKDYNKITKLLKNPNTQAKVEKIIDKNEKDLKMWCDLQNECGKYAEELYDVAKDFNPNMEPINKKALYADYDLLRKQVNRYAKENGLNPVEFDTSDLVEKSSGKVNLSKYSSIEKEIDKKLDDACKKDYN